MRCDEEGVEMMSVAMEREALQPMTLNRCGDNGVPYPCTD
jgi:hypothetical protein